MSPLWRLFLFDSNALEILLNNNVAAIKTTRLNVGIVRDHKCDSSPNRVEHDVDILRICSAREVVVDGAIWAAVLPEEHLQNECLCWFRLSDGALQSAYRTNQRTL